MNVSDVIRRVRETAGDVAVLQFSNATLTDWINDAVRECAIDNSLLEAKAVSSTVVGQVDYNLPTDIFKLHSVWIDGYKLAVLTLDQWEDKYSGEGVTIPDGAPHSCYVYAGTLTVYPKPITVKSIQINYTKNPASIVYTGPDPGPEVWTPTTLSIPEAFHNRIVTYCLAQVAQQDDDYAKYQALMVEFKTGVIDLKHAKNETEDLYPFITVSWRDGE